MALPLKKPVKDEKLLGVKIDKHLNWDNHIDFLIDKLNSRTCLLKRAKTYLNYRLRNLLYLALINRAGGLYGRILTEVVSTDRTQ